jgi:hypothetical protein
MIVRTKVDGKTVDSMPAEPGSMAEAEIHAEAGRVFCGGMKMVCILCGREQVSDPAKKSDWRAMSFDHNGKRQTAYCCTAHFPPDNATKEAFANAYKRFLRAVQKRFRKT